MHSLKHVAHFTHSHAHPPSRKSETHHFFHWSSMPSSKAFIIDLQVMNYQLCSQVHPLWLVASISDIFSCRKSSVSPRKCLTRSWRSSSHTRPPILPWAFSNLPASPCARFCLDSCSCWWQPIEASSGSQLPHCSVLPAWRGMRGCWAPPGLTYPSSSPSPWARVCIRGFRSPWSSCWPPSPPRLPRRKKGPLNSSTCPRKRVPVLGDPAGYIT